MQTKIDNIEKIIVSLLIMEKLDTRKYVLEEFMFKNKEYRSYISYFKANFGNHSSIKDTNQSFLLLNNGFISGILTESEILGIMNIFNEETLIELLYKETIQRSLQVNFQNGLKDGATSSLDLIEQNLEETKLLLKSLRVTKEKRDKIVDYKEFLTKVILTANDDIAGVSITGVSSGFHSYDLITRGLKKAEYIILGARPSMGKTSVSLDMIAKNILDGKNTIIFSIEMSSVQMIARLLPKINPNLTLNNTLHGDDYRVKESEINNALNLLAKSGFAIYDVNDFDRGNKITPNSLRTKCEEFVAEHGDIDLVMVDYIQLMDSDSKYSDENTKMANISRDLTFIIKTFNAPWIVLSQLNRDLEKRDDKRPMLSDLRNSGALEQDADIIVFLYKDSVYLEKELEAKISKKPDDRSSAEALIALRNLKEEPSELIISKNRNGPLGVVNLTFVRSKASFYDKLNTYSFSKVEEDDIF